MIQISVKTVAKFANMESEKKCTDTSIKVEQNLHSVFPLNYFNFYRLKLIQTFEQQKKIITSNCHFDNTVTFKMAANTYKEGQFDRSFFQPNVYSTFKIFRVNLLGLSRTGSKQLKQIQFTKITMIQIPVVTVVTFASIGSEKTNNIIWSLPLELNKTSTVCLRRRILFLIG